MENSNKQEYVSLIDIIKILKKNIMFIIIFTLLCIGIVAINAIFFIKPIYRASTTAVIVKGDTNAAKNNNVQGYTQDEIELYQKMVDTYAQVAQSNAVIDRTAEELKLNSYSKVQLSKMLTAVPISGSSGETQIIKLTAESSNKDDVAKIANVYCKNFIKESMNILPVGKIEVMDPAQIPANPVSPGKIKYISVGFLFGLIFSVGIVLFRYYLDSLKIRNEYQVNRLLKIPVIVTME
ncbi:MAG: Wzz/FepE/Etk N-terminal domain-containing protein [Clostridium sp.]|nr:Wzz/FepE/Etk N-terminal domain-containing protein [Clostridium sp.]